MCVSTVRDLPLQLDAAAADGTLIASGDALFVELRRVAGGCSRVAGPTRRGVPGRPCIACRVTVSTGRPRVLGCCPSLTESSCGTHINICSEHADVQEHADHERWSSIHSAQRPCHSESPARALIHAAIARTSLRPPPAWPTTPFKDSAHKSEIRCAVRTNATRTEQMAADPA